MSNQPATLLADDATSQTTTRNKIAKRESSAVAMSQNEQAPPSMAMVLMRAVENGSSIETLERIAAMIEAAEARVAESAYNDAMARAQARIVPVANNAMNSHTSSRYAKLAQINREIVPIYSSEGLSISFDTETFNANDPIPAGQIRTIAVVSLGAHRQRFHLDLPPDDAGSAGKTNKTRVQAAGSTNQYARRYLTCMIFNVTTFDDDDGNGISPNQARRQRQQESSDFKEPQRKKGSDSQQNPSHGSEMRPQLVAAASKTEAVDSSTVAGLTKAMEHAALGHSDFVKRFPALSGLEQVRKSDSRIVMSWIADPVRK